MPKENCKYWDKCYQRNEQHLQKYNHPPKKENTDEQHTERKMESLKRKADNVESKEQENSNTSNAESKHDTEEREEFDTTELQAEVHKNIAGKNYMEIFQQRIKQSVQTEYDNLLSSNEFIRYHFLVEMPDDFYAFWKFLSEWRKDATGIQVLEYMEKQFQLQLVGPFEFLAKRFHNATIREPGDYLRHWRFYYDPPEFQTVFVRCGTGVHYGYWRDTPQDKDKLLIARNDATKTCEFDFIAGNIFDALLYYLEKDFVGTPFTAATVASTKKSLHNYVNVNTVQLCKLEQLKKSRNLKVVAKTLHKAGIVVPYDGNTQVGYRSLIVSDSELKQIINLFEHAEGENKDDFIKTKVIEKLQPVATAANIALDESDFGTSLELGLDLFCTGRPELHMLVQSLLVPAYTLLNRPQFIAISKAHMDKRRRALDLSIFELDK